MRSLAGTSGDSFLTAVALSHLSSLLLPSSSALQLKALEAAEAARKKEAERQAERQRQKADLERQRQERMKVGGEV